MSIKTILFRNIFFRNSPDYTYEYATEIYVPLESGSVMTKTTRESNHTEIKKFNITQENIDQLLALIERYNVTEWIGKPSSAPAIIDVEKAAEVAVLELELDDGSKSGITFREVPEDTGTEAEDAFRTLLFQSAVDDKMTSKEVVYPSLKESRKIIEKHGPVVAVEISSYESGMMYGSNVSRRQIIERIPDKDGVVKVTVKSKQGNNPEESGSMETGSDIISKIQEISDRENLPSWHYACTDPSIPPEFIVCDYSSSSCINIYYDDSLISGATRIKRTIGEAAEKTGGAEVSKMLYKMIRECVEASGAKPRSLSYVCECGHTGRGDKFCPNCGKPTGIQR